tara:strand:- start:241 stop:828 length:588 start_codon:yes stop_codon:yes gene_type:complete
MTLKIGIDLDNTIINYEKSFQKLIKIRKINSNWKNKHQIKEAINKSKSKYNWTAAQEEIYGLFINFAKPYKYFLEFEKFAVKNKHKLFIISHKTEYSEFSRKYNLREMSNKWLKKNIKMNKYKIFYTNTINQKIEIIKKIKPKYYIDDLIKILRNKKIPKKTQKIFFSRKLDSKILTLSDWKKIKNYIAINENLK